MTTALLALLALAAEPPSQAGTAAPTPSATPSAAATPRPTSRVLSDSRPIGASVLSVSVVSGDPEVAHATLQRIVAEVERVDALASEARSSSEVSRVNRGAGGGAIDVSPELVALLARGRELSKLARGAFALTAGGLSQLWPFDAPETLRRPPDQASVAAAVANVGDDRLGLDVERHTVTLPAGARLELRRMLRGYSLSRALAAVGELRVAGVLVALGGAVVARGDKEGKPWIVGVQDPRGPGYFALLAATSEAVVTRGDYERSFTQPDGKRYHDVLDPRTGLPAAACRSVTIVSPDPVLADVLATAVMVLGPEVGLTLVEQSPDAGAVLVTSGNEVVVSPRLRDRVRVLRAPTS